MLVRCHVRGFLAIALILVGAAACAAPTPVASPEAKMGDIAAPVGSTASRSVAAVLAADRISGTVTTAGAPISGVTVKVLKATDQHEVDSQTTGNDGGYQSKRLIAGKYIVLFQPSQPTLRAEYFDNTVDVAAATQIQIPPGPNAGPVNADLESSQPAQPTGLVIDSQCPLVQSGTTTDGVLVYCQLPEGPEGPCALTVHFTLACSTAVPTVIVQPQNGGPAQTPIPAQAGAAPNEWVVTIPPDAVRSADSLELRLTWHCEGFAESSEVIAILGLCDPGGRVTDTTRIKGVGNVQVTLYHDNTSSVSPCPNTPSQPQLPSPTVPYWENWTNDNPAAVGAGITPPTGVTINPTNAQQTTLADGYFGWLAGAGCFHVEVSKLHCPPGDLTVASPWVNSRPSDVSNLYLRVNNDCNGTAPPATPKP
jgi:hypothetical protein